MQRERLKKPAYALFTLAGVAAGVWVVLQLSWAGLSEALQRADWLLLSAAAAVAILVNAARAARFQLFFPESTARLRLFATFGLIRLLGVLMPLRSGEVAGLALLKKQGVVPSVAEAAPAWLATRLFDVFAVAGLLAVVLLVRPGGAAANSALAWLGVGCAVGLVVLAAAWALRRRSSTNTQADASWIRQRLAAAGAGLARLTLARMALATCWTTLVWLGMGGLVVLTMLAFQTPLSLASCAAIALTMIAITLLPIHGPLGLGSVELAWVLTLGYSGVAAEQAAALAVCFRLALTGMVLLDGAVALGIFAAKTSSQARTTTDPTLCPPA